MLLYKTNTDTKANSVQMCTTINTISCYGH